MEGIALRTRNPADLVALRGVRVHARLAGMSQRTTVEQTFVNLEPRAIEAVYTFPLPEGAAVCAFEVVTGDRVLTGTVDENDRAIERYEDAIAEGDGAFLMEQERPDVFTVRIGNLKPRQAATVRLTYVCALERVDKQIRVAFPTTVAPRYVTATGTDPLEAMVDGDALNPPHALYVPYGLSLTVEIDLGRELTHVYSPSHAIHVVRPVDGRDAVVTLDGGVTEMNRDVVLNLQLAREHEPSVQVERGTGPDGESFLAVTFVPEFDEGELAEPAPMETVFLLDCSASMQGEPIHQAVVALELCLRSLSPGDTFNVCRFGSRFELMSAEALAYSQSTLERAIQYVRQPADLGGTEIHAPLSAVLKMPLGVGQARQVVLLTDGQVSNEQAIIELARKHRARNRVFTFGIGPACGAHLVKGLARATGGAAEFITAGERIDEKVLRTFSRLASPIVRDVSIDWDGCDVQTLAELPPVFDGDVMSVFGRCPGRLPRRVTLSCHTPAGPRSWAVPVGQPADLGGVVATMWARRAIQSLEEVNALPHVPKAAKTREQEMLVTISKRFGLLCRLTTFVAVEHRTLAERNAGHPALRRVPVQLADGWGGIELGAPAACGGAAGAPMACGISMGSTAGNTIDKTMDQTIDRLRSSVRKGFAAPRSKAKESYLDRKLDRCVDRSIDCSLDLDAGAPGGGDDRVMAPVRKLVRVLLAEAFRHKASHIEIAQRPDRVAVHYRIDGQSVERDRMPLKLRRPLFSMLREMAGTRRVIPADAPSSPVEWHLHEQPTPGGDSMVLTAVAVGSPAPPPPPAELLQSLLARQTADGWFEWDEHAVGSGERRQHLESAVADWLGGMPDLKVIATVGILARLRAGHRDERDLWRRADRKAARWLAGAVNRTPAEVETWLDALAADPARAAGVAP